MSTKCKSHTPEFKFKLALEAIKESKTIVQIAAEHEIHPRQITRWRDQLLADGEGLFIHKKTQQAANSEPGKEELLHLVNQLSLELEFLKKKLRRSV